MKAPLHVLTYSRVSTDDKGQRPEVQRDELRRFCAARDWEIAEEIIDHGYSGGTDDRPGLKKLLKMVRSRQVDAVVVVKLDRLFRSLKHLVATLDEFQALGVLFCATADAIDYSTPSGRLFAQILGCLAEFEKSLLIERTKMGLAYARSQGKRLGRPSKHDPEVIRQLRASGLSYRAIQKKLGVSMGSITHALHGALKTPSKIAPKNTRKAGGGNA